MQSLSSTTAGTGVTRLVMESTVRVTQQNNAPMKMSSSDEPGRQRARLVRLVYGVDDEIADRGVVDFGVGQHRPARRPARHNQLLLHTRHLDTKPS